jgi:hypothetical protein
MFPQRSLQPPVFVVGYMHSGTTLLLNIIANNSVVLSLGGETKFFEFFPLIREQFPDLEDDEQLRAFIPYAALIFQYGYQLKYKNQILGNMLVEKEAGIPNDDLDRLFRRAQNRRNYGAIFSQVADYFTIRENKSRWLEKTPTHIYHLDKILKSIPEARFVEIVRDPRDVLASKKTRKETVWTTDRYKPQIRPIKNMEKAFDPIWDTLAWKSAVRAGLRAHEDHPTHICTIRYEDLVTDPQPLVEEVCHFLNLPFEPAMLAITYRNAADWQVQQRNQGINSDSIGRWRNVLDLDEAALCQHLARSEMQQLDYDCLAIPIIKQLGMAPLAVTSSFEFIQRLINRWRLGGFRYLVTVLTNYWKRFLKLT